MMGCPRSTRRDEVRLSLVLNCCTACTVVSLDYYGGVLIGTIVRIGVASTRRTFFTDLPKKTVTEENHGNYY